MIVNSVVSLQFWSFAGVLLSLALFVPVPAMAIVVVDENFEDDIANDSLPSLTGPPTNIKPGRWIENQYVVPALTEEDPWFDEFDADPDTNWQMTVTSDIGHVRPGNEGYFRNNHQGDCPEGFNGAPAPCNSDQFARDGFLQFTDAAGNPRPIARGETIRARFDFMFLDGVPVFVLTNDVQQMADDTATDEFQLPLTKWDPGFGRPFNPNNVGQQVWASQPNKGISDIPFHPNVVSVLSMANAFSGGRAFETYVYTDPDDPSLGTTPLKLDPDFTFPFQVPGVVWPYLEGNQGPAYATLEFEYTVGNSTFDSMKIDGVDVTIAEDESNAFGPVPISQPGIANQIDGIVFTDTKSQSVYLVDDICIVIDGSFDDCGEGPAPLLGDANNDNQVTGSDLIAVQQNFGKVDPNMPTAGFFLGDANNDGLNTGADLIAVQQNFGQVGPGGPMTPIPEPSAMTFFVLIALMRRRSFGSFPKDESHVNG